MALKPDRQVNAYELAFYLDEVATQGTVLVAETASSGADMDSVENMATVAANPSGTVPLGILLDDFVDIDQTRYRVNINKPEFALGNKASIARKGWVVTDKIHPDLGATFGSTAVLGPSGLIGDAPAGWIRTHENYPYIGRFESGEDENGYAKVFIDL
jgi:hypothetical protein